jgi:hypothetical protein
MTKADALAAIEFIRRERDQGHYEFLMDTAILSMLDGLKRFVEAR